MSKSPQMSSSPPAASKRIAYLDGLRGLAAVQVVLAHCVLAFAPGIHDGPLRLICDGDFAVFLFFLMSGFVLTFSFEREPLAVAASTVRRIIRLGLPLSAAAFLCFVAAASLPELHFSAAQLSGSTWLANLTPADPIHALADVVGAGMVFGYEQTGLFQQFLTLPWPYTAAPDAPQWSLHIEFWGSLLLIALVFCRNISWALYAMALGTTALAIGGNALILFVVGNFVAYALRAPQTSKVLAGKFAGLVGAGLFLAGLVLDYGDRLPLLWRLDQLRVSGFLVTPYVFFHFSKELGATLTFVGIFALPAVQAFLRMRAIAWLGTMSFSIYLLHWGVMLTLGSWVYTSLMPHGASAAITAALASVLVVTLLAAFGFERCVDRVAIRLSHTAWRRRSNEILGAEPRKSQPGTTHQLRPEHDSFG